MIYKIENDKIQIMPPPTVKKYGSEPDFIEFREPTNKDYLDLLREIVILQDRLDQCLKETESLNTNLKLANPYNRNIYTIKRLDDIINIIKGEQKDENN